MARSTSGFHHVGTALLFIGAVLLLITTITAPVVHDISMLKVYLTNATDIRKSSITFGTFGYCVLDVPPNQTDQDYCSPRVVGYQPAAIIAVADNTDFSSASGDTADNLTKVQILHPVVCGLAFISFLVALGSGFCGSLMAALLAFVTFLLTLVVMATDFVAWGIIKNHVNSDGSGSTASFGAGMWTLLAAMVVLFFGAIIIFLSCCTSRRKARNNRLSTKTDYVDGPGVPTRRRWYQRRSRY